MTRKNYASPFRKTAEQRRCEEREALYHKQANCTHYNCEVTEWHWSGKPREMQCSDCGETKYIEDDEA